MIRLLALIAGLLAIPQDTDPAPQNGITETRILLGQSVISEGTTSTGAKAIRTGLTAFLERLNGRGGIDGREVVLEPVERRPEAPRTARPTEALIAREGVFAMIGGLVRFRGSQARETERLVGYLVDERKLDRIAFLQRDDARGDAARADLENALARRGLELTAAGRYRPGTIAIARGLHDIAAQSPQAVLVNGSRESAVAFIKAAKKNPALRGTVFCCTSEIGTLELLRSLGTASEGCIVSQVVPFPWDTEIAVVAEYHEAMLEADQIGFETLEGYLAGKVFEAAMRRVHGPLTRTGFVQALEQTRPMDLGGITASYGARRTQQGLDRIFLTKFTAGKVLPL